MIDLPMNLVFIFFSLCIITSVSVITARNPVYAVLWLVSLFVSTAGFLLLFGVQFLAFVYILVYVGAVLILFLWVVMTIPLKKNPFLHFRLSFTLLVLFLLSVLLITVFTRSYIKVCHFTPGNPLFSIYAGMLNDAVTFKIRQSPLPGSDLFTELSKILPGNLIIEYFHYERKFLDFQQDIVNIFNIQRLVYPAPITENTVLFEKLKSAYFLKHKDSFIENILFYSYISEINLFHTSYLPANEFFINSKIETFILIPDPKNVLIFSKILPSSVDLGHFVFFNNSFNKELPLLLESSKWCQGIKFQTWFDFFSQSDFKELSSLSTSLYVTNGFALLMVVIILLVSLLGAIFLVKTKNRITNNQKAFSQLQKQINVRSIPNT